MRIRQIHDDTRIPVINIWIETQFENVHAKLKDSIVSLETTSPMYRFDFQSLYEKSLRMEKKPHTHIIVRRILFSHRLEFQQNNLFQKNFTKNKIRKKSQVVQNKCLWVCLKAQ